MLILHRPFRTETDYAQMLGLHREIYGIVWGPICCTAGELEWWRFQENDPDAEIASTQLWETTDGALVAYAWPGPRYMNLMVHPGHRELLEPILAWAEEQQRNRLNGLPDLTTEAVDSDREHIGVLRSRGYEPTGQSRDWRIRSLETAIPAFDPPAGFSIRHLTYPEDLRQRASLAEHPYSAHLVRAPTYRPDLNLAVVAPDGRFAAFCTAWLDEQNRVGVFEPVECLPEFRRRGLTRAMMSEGMHRLRRLGAVDACIVNRSENLPAKRLYESLGFRAVGQITEWRKSIP
jgi:mycothiol synthase